MSNGTEDKERKIAELRQRRSWLREMTQMPGWQYLTELMEAQVTMRRQGLFNSSVASLDDCFTLARSQGEVSGLTLGLSLPAIAMTDLTATLQRLEQEGADENA
jgi:hypothetical protein